MWRCTARAAGPQHPWLSVLRRRALVQRTTEESSPRNMNTYFETTARLRSLMQPRMFTWGVYARMSCWNETTGLESPQSTRSSHTRNHTDSQYLHTCVGLCCSALLHAAGHTDCAATVRLPTKIAAGQRRGLARKSEQGQRYKTLRCVRVSSSDRTCKPSLPASRSLENNAILGEPVGAGVLRGIATMPRS